MRALTILLLIVLGLSSCGDYENRGELKAYLGDFGDVLVVIDRDLWEGDFGDSIKILFTDYVPAIMPAQGQFDLEFSAPENFKGSAKRFRNVLHIDIGDKLNNQEPTITTSKSEHALDQIVVYAKAKTEEDMLTLLSKRYKDIINRVNDEEMGRKQKLLSFRQDSSVLETIERKKGYAIIVPSSYKVLVDSGNVLWVNKVSSVRQDDLEKYTVRDIVISTYDYESEDMLTLENILIKKNEVLRSITFDDSDNTFIRHQEKHDPTVRIISGGNDYKMEIRSLWTKEGAFQGGPSIRYIQLDYDNRRIIHADARVYAPGNYKRELIRELEAIIKSITPIKTKE